MTKKGTHQVEYTKQEIKFLIDNYNNKTMDELSKILNKSHDSIMHKVCRLHLTRHPPITTKQHQKIISIAMTGKYTVKEIAFQVQLSSDTVRKVLKRNNIKIPKIYRNNSRGNILLKDYRPQHKGHNKRRDHSYYRHAVLFAYKNTCWDCKKTFINQSDLEAHHDFSKLPVELLLLCKECHGKRHKISRLLGVKNYALVSNGRKN